MKTAKIWIILVLALSLPFCPAKLNAQDRIHEGDSEVEVIDTGDGYIRFDEDNLERMRLSSGRLGIGTTTPAERIHVYGGNLMVENHEQTVYFSGRCYSNLNRSAAVYFYRSRGTKAAPLAITTNDAMGFFGFVGYDGTAYSSSEAYFKASADGPWSPTSHPTHMLFATCEAGSTTAQARLFINSAGNVGIGTVTPGNPLDVESSTPSTGTAVIRGEYTYMGNTNGIAVEGVSTPADHYGIGGRFTGGWYGVQGYVYPSGSGIYKGVLGSVYSNTGGGNRTGIHGYAASWDSGVTTGTNYGVYGYSVGYGTNYGVHGYAYGPAGSGSTNYGVYGRASGGLTNYAGYFAGDVHVGGILTKGGGAFKIDHPLDPTNKYLYHSFVESPDMKNVYDGVVVLDVAGEASVQLPDWFEALNRDFRYQLTCIGGFAHVYIANKISGNQFKIAGGDPGMEVSWLVTGIRKDAYAEAHRIPVEEDKSPGNVGSYIHPTELGMPETMGIDYEPPRDDKHPHLERTDNVHLSP